MTARAEPVSSPGRGDRRRLRRGDQRLHRADRARAERAADRVPGPGDQAGPLDARGRRLPPQRPVPERDPGGAIRPPRHRIWARTGRELLNLHPGRPRLEPDPAIDLGPDRRAAARDRTRRRALGPVPARGRRCPSIAAPERRRPTASRRRRRIASRRAMTCRRGDRGEQQLGGLGRPDLLAGADHGQRPAPGDPAALAPLLGPPGRARAGTSSAPASRRCPGVSVGHNERGRGGSPSSPSIRKTCTSTRPTRPTRPATATAARWEAMRVVRETVPVKGQAAVEAELKFTRHGPVLHEDREHHRAYALRAAWLEEGTAPYLAQPADRPGHELGGVPRGLPALPDPLGEPGLGRRRRPHRLAGRRPGAGPPRLGRAAAGPRRRPVRVGRLPARARAASHGSTRPGGWLATANQDNLPRGYPFAVGFQWTDPFRFARIEEVLGSGRRFTLTDMMQLQHDELELGIADLEERAA